MFALKMKTNVFVLMLLREKLTMETFRALIKKDLISQ